MKYVEYFAYILGASIVSGVLGGVFGAAIGRLSPEFVEDLFAPDAQGITRYAAALGAIWGLLLGTAAMAFCIAVEAVTGAIRASRKGRADRKPHDEPL